MTNSEVLLVKAKKLLFRCVCVRAHVCTHSCPTLCDPMDCSQPGSSVHGILQARVLEWVANFSSRGSSWPRDWTWISYITGELFIIWATREAPYFLGLSPQNKKIILFLGCVFLFVFWSVGNFVSLSGIRKPVFKMAIY